METNFSGSDHSISDREQPPEAIRLEAELATMAIFGTDIVEHSDSNNDLALWAHAIDRNPQEANSDSLVKIHSGKSRIASLNGDEECTQVDDHGMKSHKVDDITKGKQSRAKMLMNHKTAHRKNAGRRRQKKALTASSLISTSDEFPSTSSNVPANFRDSHVNELKHSKCDGKLHLAAQYFVCFMDQIKEIVAEECPVNSSKVLESCQSPSQYLRFRFACTMLLTLKRTMKKLQKALSKLTRLEHDLQDIKTQLGTHRESFRSFESSKSGTADDDGDSQDQPSRLISRRVTKGVTNSTTAFTPVKAVEAMPEKEIVPEYMFHHLGNNLRLNLSGLNYDDENLKISPKVVMEKMTAEEIMHMKSTYLLDYDGNNCCNLNDDFDSLTYYQKSLNDSSTTDLTGVEEESKEPSSKKKTENLTVPGKVKAKVKKKGFRKEKVYESDEPYYEMDEDFESDSDIATGMKADEGTICLRYGVQDDNTIAKNSLLEQMQNEDFDSYDSDVERLLSKGRSEVEGKNMKKMSRSNQGSCRSTTYSCHSLLKRNWKDTSGIVDKSVIENCSSGELKSTVKRRCLADKHSGEVAAKKRKISIEPEDHSSEVDLSRDSDDDSIKYLPSRATRLRITTLDSVLENVVPSKAMQNAASENDFSVEDIEDCSGSEQKRTRHGVIMRSVFINHDENSELSEQSQKGGRRNIKKVIDDDELCQSTQQAKKEELKRRKRVEMKREGEEVEQNVIIFDQETNEEISKSVTVRLILSKNPLVEVHSDLVKCLKPHQIEGVQFMWDNLIEKVNIANTKSGTGCILSHVMGLGKTLQTVAFLHTVLLCYDLPKLRCSLILCPYSLVSNWKQEFKKWMPKSNQLSDGKSKRLSFSCLGSCKSESKRISTLRLWRERGGVLIMGYELFRSILTKKQPSTAEPNDFGHFLLNPGPDILVCDEGHKLKNSTSAISMHVSKVSTKRKLILTGTPLQNNMVEYYCVVDLVKPKLLGDLKEFKNYFVNPIENGQHVDSTNADVKLMKERAHILHELLAGCMHRKDFTCLKEKLPPKYEYTLKVPLSELQIRLYEKYLSCLTTTNLKTNTKSLFKDFSVLLLLACHPGCLLIDKERQDKKLKLMMTKHGGNYMDGKEKRELVNPPKSLVMKEVENEHEWYEKFMPSQEKLSFAKEHGAKIVLMLEILHRAEKLGDKVVVFSQSPVILDLIEHVLTAEMKDVANGSKPPAGKFSQWIRNKDYYRLDRLTNERHRARWISRFNDPHNGRARLFLIATLAGGDGFSLIGANRAIILDVSWNPFNDVQSVSRLYRFGQNKPCYIYRLVAQGTMEEKVYKRQVRKRSLSFRVIDEQQISRHFIAADAAELYTFKPYQSSRNESARSCAPPHDTLLASIINSSHLIASFHEPDILLGHQEAEELTKAEQKAAWEEYDKGH